MVRRASRAVRCRSLRRGRGRFTPSHCAVRKASTSTAVAGDVESNEWPPRAPGCKGVEGVLVQGRQASQSKQGSTWYAEKIDLPPRANRQRKVSVNEMVKSTTAQQRDARGTVWCERAYLLRGRK